VHIAPGHGDVDNRLGKHYGLPDPSPVDDSGHLTKEAGQFEGIFVKKADSMIIEYLEKSGRLLKMEKIVHSYPLCWRCKSPLIYRMSSQWYLKVDPIRKKILKENGKVNWLPGFGGERFHNLILEAPDWAITRQRYWGIPMPVWSCDKCGERKIVGSKKELEKLSGQKIPDLHKDVVDKVAIGCRCGGKMRRVKDIMDVWFDSGISPWASLGYPFGNRHLFERLWNVDLIDESQDQIRGWFYSLMLCGISVFDEAPYRTVCLNGWTLDEKGEKMSKSLGNVVDASDAREALGSDLLRFYYCYDTSPWETQKFSMHNAKDLHRVMNVLWNTYVFVETYCCKEPRLPAEMSVEDEWIVSRVSSLIKSVTEDMEGFRFSSASRALADFILNDFSRWYIKLIRNRVSPWYEGKDKKAAQHVSAYVLEKTARLMAPFAPFISEKIYKEMFPEKGSVHDSRWPSCSRERVNEKLEEQMKVVDSLIEAMNFARQEAGVKLKWPLKEVHVRCSDRKSADAVRHLKSIVANMGNVKEVSVTDKLAKGGRAFEYGEFALGEILKDEALARELERCVQVQRKKEGLKVTQKISLVLETDKETEGRLKPLSKDIMEGVGGASLNFSKVSDEKGKVDFEGSKIRFWFGPER
jgi:isoleucyl-tRNA synthetase